MCLRLYSRSCVHERKDAQKHFVAAGCHVLFYFLTDILPQNRGQLLFMCEFMKFATLP